VVITVRDCMELVYTLREYRRSVYICRQRLQDTRLDCVRDYGILASKVEDYK
jgi:hypothetical protein